MMLLSRTVLRQPRSRSAQQLQAITVQHVHARMFKDAPPDSPADTSEDRNVMGMGSITSASTAPQIP